MEQPDVLNGFRQVYAQNGGAALAPEGELPAAATALMLEAVRFLLEREQTEGTLCGRLEKQISGGCMPKLSYGFEDVVSVKGRVIAALTAQGVTQAEQELLRQRHFVNAGLALYVWFMAERFITTADLVTAMTLEAVRGERGAFDARLHELGRPFPGQIASAANVRQLIDGSEMTTEEGRRAFGYDKHPRVQDAISLRAAPQTHGGVRDVHAWLGACIREELQRGLVRDGLLLEYGVDWLLTALADLGNISEERTFRLTEEKFSYGLPTNLVFHQGYNHGYPVVQACQAAMLAELKLKALPSAAIKTGCGCMAYESCVRAVEALPLLCRVLATEALMAAQAMDIVQDRLRELSFGRGTRAAWQAMRTRVDVLVENRFVAPDMCAADELVWDGTLLAAAENAVGALQ